MNNLIHVLWDRISGIFIDKHERSVKAKNNIAVSFVVRILSIVVSFLLVPLTIDYINPTRYGVWLTLSSIIAWFGFFDIGFGNGLRNKFAEAVAQGKTEQARIYVSTTYAILAIIIAVVFLIFFVISPLLDWSVILNTEPEMAEELGLLAMIVFLCFCVQFVLQLVDTVLAANQEPAKASIISFLGNLLSLIIIFVLTKTTSGNLVYLGTAIGISPVIILILASVILYSKSYKPYAPSIKYVKFSHAKDLMILGLKFFIIQVSVVVLYQSSNIIIAQLFGPEQVTPYNLAYKYFGIIPMFFTIITTPYWSAITDAWVRKDIEWIRTTMNNLMLVWAIVTCGTVVMLLGSNLFYRIWVGGEVSVPFRLSLVMAVYVIVNAWNGIFSVFLNGTGIIKLQYLAGIWGMILNIPMAIWLGRHIGVEGVVLSTVILGAINMIWSYIQYKKNINFTAKGIWAK